MANTTKVTKAGDSNQAKITPLGGNTTESSIKTPITNESLKNAEQIGSVVRDLEDGAKEKVKVSAEVVSGSNAEVKAERPKQPSPRKRIPLGARNVLTAQKRPGYVRRFVNDVGDRIRLFKEAGWTPVGDTPVGDAKIGKVTSMGSTTNPHVGLGQRAVLMEIPENYYEEDEKAKQDRIDQVEQEMKRNSKHPGKDGLSGKVTIS